MDGGMAAPHPWSTGTARRNLDGVCAVSHRLLRVQFRICDRIRRRLACRPHGRPVMEHRSWTTVVGKDGSLGDSMPGLLRRWGCSAEASRFERPLLPMAIPLRGAARIPRRQGFQGLALGIYITTGSDTPSTAACARGC